MKISFTGTHGTGKTTAVEMLAEKLRQSSDMEPYVLKRRAK